MYLLQFLSLVSYNSLNTGVSHVWFNLSLAILFIYLFVYLFIYLSMQSKFISDPFPWKRMDLPMVGGGGERHRLRAKQGGKSKGGRMPGWQGPGWPESQERESFVLRTYIVGRMGVKKLRID